MSLVRTMSVEFGGTKSGRRKSKREIKDQFLQTSSIKGRREMGGKEYEIKRVICLLKKGKITDENYEVKRKSMMKEREKKGISSVLLSRQERIRLNHICKHFTISLEQPYFFVDLKKPKR